jgi:hypothetical protein
MFANNKSLILFYFHVEIGETSNDPLSSAHHVTKLAFVENIYKLGYMIGISLRRNLPSSFHFFHLLNFVYSAIILIK